MGPENGGKLKHPMTGQSNQKALYIMCDDSDHCQDFHFSDVVLYGAVSTVYSSRGL